MKKILVSMILMMLLSLNCFAKESSFIVLFKIPDSRSTLVVHVDSKFDVQEDVVRETFVSIIAEAGMKRGCNRTHLPKGLRKKLQNSIPVPARLVLFCSPAGIAP